MEVTVCGPADRNRKRKVQTELLGPLPKYVRCVQEVEYTSPPDSSKELDTDSKNLAKGSQSDPESAKDSNSFHADADSYMSEEHDEAKTCAEYPKTYASDDPSASTSSWGGTDPYSLESRSLTTYSCSKSTSEEHDYPLHGFTSLPSLNYEEHLSEFGNHDDFFSSEYKTDEIEFSTDKELENMLYSSDAAPGDYVLSSGRWSVSQDTQQATRKPTIDKEFEQYFSMLML